MRNLSRCGNNFLNSAPSVEIHHCESIKARVPAHRDRLHESTTPKAGIHNDTQQPSKPNSGSLDIRMRPMHSASIRKTSGFSSKSQLKTTNSLKTSNCIHNNQASDDTPVKSWSATSRDLKPSLCHSSKLDPKGNLFDQAVPKTNSCSPKHSKNEDIKMSSVFLHSKPNSRLRKPIALDISSLLQKTPVKPKRSKSSCPVSKVASTLPERVGKQRMNPKAKKLTPLKRMILEDRATRLKQRSSSAPAPESRVPTGIELRTDAFPPLETEFVHADPDHKDTKRLIYKKTPEVDQLIRDFLSRLASYHDRAYTTFIHDPYRQKKSRRLVCGINQVRKQIRSKQLKILIIARDLEGKAGLYETLDSSSSLNTSSPGRFSVYY
ncbi:unnamed protein product [Protopolystoma xenopodis]|uniref:Ribosomal protein L7Ae/L30e/S12e/Gadd45 domain-containing protein n=1 Tax=Protopolystoma xenopodis TaxID=117903 RepID=A0A3S5A4S9_9PLAT|nr:unnamed protein product [Protopolystoma xenopodis]